MDTGWYATSRGAWAIVCADGVDWSRELDPQVAREQSAGREAWYVHSSDVTMMNCLRVWRDGQLAWSIEYDGATEPVVSGSPPELVDEALARARAEFRRAALRQRRVDCFYEVVHEITETVLRFRYDGPPPGPGERLYQPLR